MKQNEQNRQSFPHGGDVWSASGGSGKALEKILDLSANINFLGLSARVKAAIVENIDHIVHYPDPKCSQLISALAQHLQVEEEAICAGNGAVDLLDHWLRQVQAKRVLICDPGFGQYFRAVHAQGGQAVPIRLDEQEHFRLDIVQWEKKLLDEKCDAAIICSPHNPVGWVWSDKEREAIVNLVEKHHIHVLVDESFLDFLPDGREQSCCALAVKHRQIAVLYSLTKFFAIPGIRLGALIAQRDIIKDIIAHRDPWVVNHLAQVAGVAALADLDYHKRTWEQLPQEREFLIGQLSRLPGVKPISSTANFVLAHMADTGLSSTTWTEKLRRRGILVRNCNTFAALGERYLRFAVRDSSATERLIQAMQVIMKEEGLA
ncbi:pyridoxal phosphate-dependent aminotransferase [Heliobacterium mobile]|uniref:pyridoxal phosphate-dependent aminotransferase n=1 Tax=Heliobacterium mobile TaxID=28064 RepID=UPI001478EA31|nr:aminotransferase class I/II-fold pyridoxal phosphate-dependent enzyme [Heliobacterium mobile]